MCGWAGVCPCAVVSEATLAAWHSDVKQILCLACWPSELITRLCLLFHEIYKHVISWNVEQFGSEDAASVIRIHPEEGHTFLCFITMKCNVTTVHRANVKVPMKTKSMLECFSLLSYSMSFAICQRYAQQNCCYSTKVIYGVTWYQ